MKSELFEDLLESVREAGRISRGEIKPAIAQRLKENGFEKLPSKNEYCSGGVSGQHAGL